MTPTVIIIIAVALLIAGLAWHTLGDPKQDHEAQTLASAWELQAASENNHREFRLAELQEAYEIAKEELGEEPTVEQIFLTRDQLRTQRNL